MSEEFAHYNIEPIVLSDESTVVAEFTSSEVREEAYQSEDMLERAFIEQLEKQAYKYLPIKSEEDLILNLRQKLEELNNISFSEEEWKRFFNTCIASSNTTLLTLSPIDQPVTCYINEKESPEGNSFSEVS